MAFILYSKKWWMMEPIVVYNLIKVLFIEGW